MTENTNHTDPSDETNPAALDLDLQNLDELRAAIALGERAAILALLEDEHHADISDKFEQLTTEERTTIVELVPEVLTPMVLAELEDEVLEDILPLLPSEKITDAVQELESDDAVQLFEELDDDQRAEVLAALPARDREEVEAGFGFGYLAPNKPNSHRPVLTKKSGLSSCFLLSFGTIGTFRPFT